MATVKLNPIEAQRLAIITASINHTITNGVAAQKLGITKRQVQRLKVEIQKYGALAVVHKLKGRLGNHHIDLGIKVKLLEEIKETYADFKPKFATEKLLETHQIQVTSQTIRVWMSEEGLWKMRKQKQIKYHAWRERKEYFGQLEQFDGSYHHWFERRLLDESSNPVEVCLLASIDDATSQITHVKFDFNEGVIAVFNFWKEYVEKLGKPLAIYLDKFSTYKINHISAVDNTELMTQFQKAMKILGIEVIPANSPQAKGRVERLFQTLQDRLIKELRLNKVNSIEAGNIFLKEVFIPKFNHQFSVQAAKDGNVHRVLTKTEQKSLNSTFSIKSQRRINFDYTIQFKNHFYQLEEIQPLTVRPKDKVIVEEWLDQTLHLNLKEHYLNFFVLPTKPKKVLNQPVILTTHPLNWKPPASHPWRQYKTKT